MPRCPNCHAPLPEDASACPSCGAVVRALLVSTGTPAETAMMEARLQSAGLPYEKHAHAGGGIFALLSAFSSPGADFYVPRARLGEARAALGYEDDGTDAPAAGADGVPAPHKWRGRLVGLLVIAGLLLLYFGLDAGLEAARRLLGGLGLWA